MIPRIEISPERKLIGKRLSMSLTNNKTFDLWQNFMSQRKAIQNNLGTDLYSVQLYDQSYFENFNPNAEFEKWATIEVTNFDSIPLEMESFTLKGGMYAVFLHKGAELTGAETYRFIFETWLPNSEYRLDQRPHFEILGKMYKNGDPNSEEEIWIPIRPK